MAGHGMRKENSKSRFLLYVKFLKERKHKLSRADESYHTRMFSMSQISLLQRKEKYQLT